MTLSAGQRLGAYEVLSPLGAGGMGEVYRARDTRLGREVALKVLPEALAADRDRLSRFEQEARAASALNHPNIVTIHDIGREGETAFIAMELVDGKTLRELSASGPMPVRRVLNLTAQVCEGLAKAHAAGIVHRDLKPENVMVSKDGFVKILDFGLAKLVEPESGEVSAMPTLAQPETHPGTVMGTVGYMSPEQASGEPLDFRSDQFSVGSIFYEIVTGKKAFQKRTAAETMSAIIREEPEPAGTLRPDLPMPVRWILERCLAKDAEDRYASTRDLAKDLASLRDHLSQASSGAETLLTSPGRPGRRTLALIAGLALLAIGLLAGWGLTRGFSKSPVAPSFHRLTFRKGSLGNARFAPDGQTVVYSARWDGEPPGEQLYQTRSESPESGRFSFAGDILAISGSGEMAILTGPGLRRAGATMARVSMAGGIPRDVLESVAYAGADFSPDGKDLAVAHIVDGKARLEFPIGRVLVSDGVNAPRISPDGSEVAFFENQTAVALIDRSGKSKRTLSTGLASVEGTPCWRPDGREIWFTASLSGPGEPQSLWAIDRAGRRRLIMRAPGSLELDDIARDGRVLFAHHTILYSLRAIAADSTAERELSWLDGSTAADLSRDGKKLVISEQGEGAGSAPAIYLRGTDGSPAVHLGKGFAMALSPDGKRVLAYVDSAQGGSHLILLQTGAGEPLQLPTGSLNDFGWGAFAPDGTRIVFAAAGPGQRRRLYVQEISGGPPRPFSPEGTGLQPWSNPLSPDGKTIVARQSGNFVLYPLDGGPPRAISGLRDGEWPIQWTADGRALYVFRREDNPIQIFILDLATGERKLWKEIRPPDGSGQQRVRTTPNGSLVIYGYQRVFSELYLVEGLR